MIFGPLLITYGTLACIVILTGWNLYLGIKLNRLLGGKDGKSLEGSIISAHENLDKLNQFQKEVINHFINVEKRLNRSIQSVETIRFNPFKGEGIGGNQSFSTAFLSQNGDGVVVSSLYSRDRVSIFSKPLTKFESDFELSEEEKEVVTTSKNLLK